MTDYRIIRVAEDYGLIIAVSPADATPQSETAQYYRYATWKIEPDQDAERFHAVSRNTAQGYFSGHADGLGFGVVPDQTFPSLDAVLKYCQWEKSKTPEQRLLARFYELLRSAYVSSEREDNFDLTTDPMIKQQFHDLHHRALASASDLVRYCQVYGHDLLREFLPEDMAERAKMRPANYAQLPPREQWAIDRQLGILDWSGTS